MANDNDSFLLGKVFSEYCSSEYPGLAEDDAFERFAVSQVLKPREVSAEDIESGIVDGAKDGGVDSLYVFVNGALLDVDDPLLDDATEAVKILAPKPVVEVFLIQAKNSTAWKEAVWEKLLSTLPDVLMLSQDDATLDEMYNPDVVERTGIIRRALTSLATKFPVVVFRVVYVSRAPESNLVPALVSKAKQVEEVVRGALSQGAVVTAEHLGASGLYGLAATSFGEPGKLTFRSSIIRESHSYLGVASISDYLKFVRDKAGALRDDLFDSNVRDYEGDNVVNEAIGATLSSADGVEFWWLNNGVTVLGDEVDCPQQTLTISRPLVVNGLQTSHVLDRAEREGTIDEGRLSNGIVVRVIASTDEEVRDRIIAGTNRQTQVPTPALYATRPDQIKLESYLVANGIFYERRKNRWKNQGKPARDRITMSLLAQVMITTLLVEPDNARARPSTLLGTQKGYDSIFPEGLSHAAYLSAIRLLRGVDEYLRTVEAKAILDDFTNARFYVIAGYLMLGLRAPNPAAVHFDKNYLKIKQPLSKARLDEVLAIVAQTAGVYRKQHGHMSIDATFKSSDFKDAFFKKVGAAAKKAAAKKVPAAKKAVAKKVPAAKKAVAKKVPAAK